MLCLAIRIREDSMISSVMLHLTEAAVQEPVD